LVSTSFRLAVRQQHVDTRCLSVQLATMPRASRRPPQARDDTARDDTATPTRPTATNAITGAIPPFMLQTPPHAPFLTSPLPPANNPGNSIIPNNHNLRNTTHSPTANGANGNHAAQQPHVTNNALGSNLSDTDPVDEDSLLDSAQPDADDARQLAGLRDISSLATWTLSSSKPGCALPQLRHPSPTHFWQSDGPQPHTLTLHFFKLVAIVKIRIYLDFELDESYTPTKMKFFGGMSEGGLVEFGSWEVQETIDPETGETVGAIENVRGWIEIPLDGVGGRDRRHSEQPEHPKRLNAKPVNIEPDQNEGDDVSDEEDMDDAQQEDSAPGDVLKAMVVQVRICENHQNGKDTHVRGFQVFARDESMPKDGRRIVNKGKRGDTPFGGGLATEPELVGIQEADWMGDPEVR
jgi:anaphase-promoting complex subunit 10